MLKLWMWGRRSLISHSIRLAETKYCYSATSAEIIKKQFTPRRACLYIPGNDERKIAKASNIATDCIILDCEDGVAANKKHEARTTIAKMMNEPSLCLPNTEAIVRVNSRASGLTTEDLHVIFTSKKLPRTLMLPKVEFAKDIEWFAGEVSRALDKSSEPTKVFNLIIYTESAKGLMNLTSICEAAEALQELACPFVLEGIVFGSDDFCASIGATRSQDGSELMYARQKIVVIAKAFGLQAIDMVHINYKDLDGLKHNSLQGYQMGFTGKQVIHPSQCAIVQEAFSPSIDKVHWAKELIAAFEAHQASGKGAFNFHGTMVDMPLLLQAKNILAM